MMIAYVCCQLSCVDQRISIPQQPPTNPGLGLLTLRDISDLNSRVRIDEAWQLKVRRCSQQQVGQTPERTHFSHARTKKEHHGGHYRMWQVRPSVSERLLRQVNADATPSFHDTSDSTASTLEVARVHRCMLGLLMYSRSGLVASEAPQEFQPLP